MKAAAVLIVTFSFIFMSCGNKDAIPADVLPPEKMQAVMWDMMRADRFLTNFVLNKDSSLNKNLESTKLYQQVFAIHDIDKEKFKRSFSYYEAHPSLLKTMMDSLSKEPVIVDTISAKPPDTTIQKLTQPLKDTAVLPKRKRIIAPAVQ